MRIPILLLTLAALAGGCSGGEGARTEDETSGEGPAVAPTSEPSDPAITAIGEGSEGLPSEGEEGPSAPIRVVVMGTSLTEGLGLARPEVEGWPARVAVLADSAGYPVELVNAGVSGETSSGALTRIEWVLRQNPDLLVIETGANDGLRGLPVDEVAANLDRILATVKSVSPATAVALVAMEAPTSHGEEYTSRFRQLFPTAAAEHGVALTPFLLDGVAGVRELNQADQVHPTAEGHLMMARNVWPVLDSLLSLVPSR